VKKISYGFAIPGLFVTSTIVTHVREKERKETQDLLERSNIL
jgi:hypothetical protein